MQAKLSLTLVAVLAVFGASIGGSQAQAPPAPATPMAGTAAAEPVPSTECGPVKPRPNAGADTTVGQANEPLGDKLAKSNGVLCPPSGVDPAMRAPTPDSGITPVIPPPGSPGGNPTVQPK